MSQLIGYLVTLIGAISLGIAAYATFVAMPKKDYGHKSVEIACRQIKWLRGGKMWQMVLYWLLPVFIFFFTSTVGGVFFIATAIIGLMFKGRYELSRADIPAPEEAHS